MASSVEMLSGRRKKDHAAESAAEALQLQGDRVGGLAGNGRDGALADPADPIADEADLAGAGSLDEDGAVAA